MDLPHVNYEGTRERAVGPLQSRNRSRILDWAQVDSLSQQGIMVKAAPDLLIDSIGHLVHPFRNCGDVDYHRQLNLRDFRGRTLVYAGRELVEDVVPPSFEALLGLTIAVDPQEVGAVGFEVANQDVERSVVEILVPEETLSAAGVW
ncbi:MAG: hypothetical protein HYY17_03060 [Planctomycetes bacterium]|nr:hypothetical protein [Planctomycetota bacterium]